MKSSACRNALLLYISLLLLSLVSWQLTDADKTSVKSKNSSFQLPKIFDWDHYKTSFQKIYPTIRDELARKKLFIASALQTFMHNLAFRLGNMDYYLSINQFSDSTPEELRRMVSGIKPRKEAGGDSESSVNGQNDEMEPLTGVDLERLKQMLARIVAEKQPGYQLLAQQLQITIDNHRPKRDVGVSDQVDVDGVKLSKAKTKEEGWRQMSRSDRRHYRRQRNSNMKIDEYRSLIGDEQPKESSKFVKRVPSTNPEHTQLELFSQAANTDGNEEGLPEQQLNLLEIIPNSADFVERQFTWLTDTFRRMTSEDDEDSEEQDDSGVDAMEDSSAEGQDFFAGENYSFNDQDMNETVPTIAQLVGSKNDAMNAKIGAKMGQTDTRTKRACIAYLSDVSDRSKAEDQVDSDYRDHGCLAFPIASIMEWVREIDNRRKSRARDKRVRLGYVSDVSEFPIEDQIYLDYRQDGCLTVPRDQSMCGSCYAFSIVALMEWWHCKQTGELVPFSEQYIVDCGRHVGMEGCEGTNLGSIERFVRDWGVELRADYPYLDRESVCPYEKEDWHRAGYKRPVVLSYEAMNHRALWPILLKLFGPALAVINIPRDFHAYGGLVHKGHNCKQTHHSMLLVGHGIENGQEYWLLRNSYGHIWGEQGYFKLSKAAKNDCYFEVIHTELDFLRPPLQPIEITEQSGHERVTRKLTPYEAHRFGLIVY